MPIHQNTSSLSAIYKGSSQLSKVYVGSTQIWPDAAPALEVDFLIVGGGGGGSPVSNNSGYQHYGGAGGGGVVTSSGSSNSGGGSALQPILNLSTATNYSVTVGAGGAQLSYGSNSSFSTITVVGGANGRRDSGLTGAGGSGAGLKSNFTVVSGGSGTSGQGFGGGQNAGVTWTYGAAGGGGGAGGAGLNGTMSGSTGYGGRGGNGITNNLTGTSITYGCGSGGAGNKNSNISLPSGYSNSPNTGGAGKPISVAGLRPGGSGVVCIKYPSSYTLTVGAGLTSSTTQSGDYKITAGTDNIQFN
jgi:hypothetical protein